MGLEGIRLKQACPSKKHKRAAWGGSVVSQFGLGWSGRSGGPTVLFGSWGCSGAVGSGRLLWGRMLGRESGHGSVGLVGGCLVRAQGPVGWVGSADSILPRGYVMVRSVRPLLRVPGCLDWVGRVGWVGRVDRLGRGGRVGRVRLHWSGRVGRLGRLGRVAVQVGSVGSVGWAHGAARGRSGGSGRVITAPQDRADGILPRG